MAGKIASCVSEKGGRTFLVGGYVRDLLMGIESKDIDIEIHGIKPEQLEEILDGLGSRTQMGASFGVYGLRGYDIDIAMPRQEEATGRGHKDFKIYVDPFLGTYKAAMRRDFTINAMMQDVLTGEIIDHFAGREDLEKGIIRHVNEHTFTEDPLRVLRAAQFASRFEFEVAPQTVELSKSMDLTTLARERVMGELEKALQKAKHPSIFFSELRNMEQLKDWFFALTLLIDDESQNKWDEVMKLLDIAAKMRSQAENPQAFMTAVLTIYLGKLEDTSQQKKTIVKEFLEHITNETKLIRYVVNMADLYMLPYSLAEDKADKKETNRMFDKSAAPSDLLLLAKADRIACESYDEKQEAFLKERLLWYQKTMAKPCVMGGDLIKAGLKPGPDFSHILAYAHELHLADVDKDMALRLTLDYAQQYNNDVKGEN